MNHTYQMNAWRFDDGSYIVAPRFGFTYDIPWMAPHASGRLLDSAIRHYQMGCSVDAAHKVTPSRNKREGRYVGRWQGLAYRSRAEDTAFDEMCARIRLYNHFKYARYNKPVQVNKKVRG